MSGITHARLRDPLNDVTRKVRRTLLGLSILGIIVDGGGLLPTKISTLGIEFSQNNQELFIRVLVAVVVYYLVAFIIYAVADYVSWKVELHKAIREWIKIRESTRDENKIMDDMYKKLNINNGEIWFNATGPVSVIRSTFEFLIPILVGTYAVILLLTD